MIKNKSGESLVGIVIGIFILSFVLLGVANLLISSKSIVYSYSENKAIHMLSLSAKNISNKVDLSNIGDNEIFYIYNDKINKKYTFFTGSINENYQYIDKDGDYINNTGTFLGNIYSRSIEIDRIDFPESTKYKSINVTISKIIK